MRFRSHLRPVKRTAGRLLERLYALGFACAGRVRVDRADPWLSPGGQRILVVAPHPDDEAIGCVGTVLRHLQFADTVCIAIATDGRQSTVIIDPDAMASQRRREAVEAARMMGVQRFEWLNFREGSWRIPEMTQRIKSLTDEFQPDVIYAPSRIDFHPEHRAVAHALALALEQSAPASARVPIVRIYQIQVPLDPGMVNLVCPVTDLQAACGKVLRAYQSQSASIESIGRHRRYTALLHGSAGQMEAFWQIDAQRYIALHREPPARWSEKFRGLRHFPLTDPLAYWVGRGGRRTIKAIAAGPP